METHNLDGNSEETKVDYQEPIKRDEQLPPMVRGQNILLNNLDEPEDDEKIDARAIVIPTLNLGEEQQDEGAFENAPAGEDQRLIVEDKMVDQMAIEEIPDETPMQGSEKLIDVSKDSDLDLSDRAIENNGVSDPQDNLESVTSKEIASSDTYSPKSTTLERGVNFDADEGNAEPSIIHSENLFEIGSESLKGHGQDHSGETEDSSDSSKVAQGTQTADVFSFNADDQEISNASYDGDRRQKERDDSIEPRTRDGDEGNNNSNKGSLSFNLDSPEVGSIQPVVFDLQDEVQESIDPSSEDPKDWRVIIELMDAKAQLENFAFRNKKEEYLAFQSLVFSTKEQHPRLDEFTWLDFVSIETSKMKVTKETFEDPFLKVFLSVERDRISRSYEDQFSLKKIPSYFGLDIVGFLAARENIQITTIFSMPWGEDIQRILDEESIQIVLIDSGDVIAYESRKKTIYVSKALAITPNISLFFRLMYMIRSIQTGVQEFIEIFPSLDLSSSDFQGTEPEVLLHKLKVNLLSILMKDSMNLVDLEIFVAEFLELDEWTIQDEDQLLANLLKIEINE